MPDYLLCKFCSEDPAILPAPRYVSAPLGYSCGVCGDRNLNNFTLLEGKVYCVGCSRMLSDPE